MKLVEIFESKKVVKSPPPRNFVAKHSQTAGAGPHEPKKYKRSVKHKNKDNPIEK